MLYPKAEDDGEPATSQPATPQHTRFTDADVLPGYYREFSDDDASPPGTQQEVPETQQEVGNEQTPQWNILCACFWLQHIITNCTAVYTLLSSHILNIRRMSYAISKG